MITIQTDLCCAAGQEVHVNVLVGIGVELRIY